MITNERQLQIAQARLEEFEAAIAENDERGGGGLHHLIATAQADALIAQRDELAAEIAAYERLRSGKVQAFEIASLGDLPRTLIEARIAAGLNQRELASRLGLKEQQIQRYEAHSYEGASFSRIVDVADAIGVDVPGRLEILSASSPEAILARARTVGVDEELVNARILPPVDRSRAGAGVLADRLEVLFEWSPTSLTGSEALVLPGDGGRTARYKLPKGRDARAVAAYTAYSHGLARICAQAMAAAPRDPVPTDWEAFREAVLERYGELSFRSVLDFAWDIGVVVLPLGDGGSFHGACWRIDSVNVVVLKQATRSVDRWLHDLLHELHHAGQAPDHTHFEVVEAPETSEERRLDPEEKRATWFASQTVLTGRSEDLFKLAIKVAGNDLRRLKRAVADVSERENADLGALANYAAFRLSLQGENWWGAAHNLQDMRNDPLALARDRFYDRFDFSSLDQTRLELLTLAMNDEAHNG